MRRHAFGSLRLAAALAVLGAAAPAWATYGGAPSYVYAPPAVFQTQGNTVAMVPQTQDVVQTVFETTYQNQPYTVYQTRLRTEWQPESFTVMRPVTETINQQRTFTVMRPVTETINQQRTFTVMRPVTQTINQERRYTVLRPVTETTMINQTSTVSRPASAPPADTEVARAAATTEGQADNQVERAEGTARPSPQSVVPVQYVTETQTRQVPVQTTRWVPEEKVETI